MIDVVMPQMGESIVEGTLTRWLKKPGEKVERDEPLFEISTDKVDTEIPSPGAGVLAEVLVEEGKTVGINAVVGRIQDTDGAGPAQDSADGAGSRAAQPPPAAPPPQPPQAQAAPTPPRAPAPQAPPQAPPGGSPGRRGNRGGGNRRTAVAAGPENGP
jgi:2-oxoglutarate dehydrogenase E2 component (dihydrolipoamide succinyltransferase)